MSALKPPRIDTFDPGAHELSDSDDHFSSADEGTTPNPNRLSAGAPPSPVPVTRVERVDDQPAHGEVPGTPAYELRTKDAVPDEVEIVPEGKRSRSGTQSRGRSMSHLSQGSRPNTPGGSPIPKTVVERVDDKPAHGEVDGTLAKEMRMADAAPDEVITAPSEARDGQIDGRAEDDQPVDEEQRQAWFRSMWEEEKGERNAAPPDEAALAQPEEEEAGQADDDDAFGDDFDDFNEGGGGDDDDFGDFDEAEAAVEEEPAAEEPPPAAQPVAPDVLAGLVTISPYITAILPPTTTTTTDHQPTPGPPPKQQYTTLPPLNLPQTSPFLSDRSLSLWQQLVSPPPMQPPDWTRSRIRRLFLVSLGVPVDLDEILPPSGQGRLVLPNINITLHPSASGTPRASTALERLKDQEGGGGANTSTTSLDSKTGQPKKSSSRRGIIAGRPGPPPPPDFDLNAAALVCSTTPLAMSVYGDEELRQHVQTLERLNGRASGVLEYWLQRKDEGLKEKEALEGVIENLVGFVKGRRGGR
ncbi:hypothetical protein LTR65_003388 [Meristemomyces frigidus]